MLAKQFNLPLRFVPRKESLIEIPAEPLNVGVFLERFDFTFNVVDRSYQRVLGFDHAFEGVRHRRGLARKAIRFKEAEAGKIFDKPRPLRVGPQGIRFGIVIPKMTERKAPTLCPISNRRPTLAASSLYASQS